jgi:predicted HTH domain antitoxin
MNANDVKSDEVAQSQALGEPGEQLTPALAASYFKDKVLSLGAAAQVSGLSLSEFIEYLTQLNIDVVVPDQLTAQESKTLDSWLP